MYTFNNYKIIILCVVIISSIYLLWNFMISIFAPCYLVLRSDPIKSNHWTNTRQPCLSNFCHVFTETPKALLSEFLLYVIHNRNTASIMVTYICTYYKEDNANTVAFLIGICVRHFVKGCVAFKGFVWLFSHGKSMNRKVRWGKLCKACWYSPWV